jgi:hypothetical protein
MSEDAAESLGVATAGAVTWDQTWDQTRKNARKGRELKQSDQSY